MNAKQLLIFIAVLSLVPAASVGAREIEWSPAATADTEKIPASMTGFVGAGTAVQNRIMYENSVAELRQRIPTVEVDDTVRSIRYYKGATLTGKSRNTDIIGSYKEKALNFISNAFPFALAPGETLTVLFVEEDYGAEQERGAATGEILPNVNLKTYSYNVKVSRRLHGHPIFNSISSIEYDPASDEVVSFSFQNWSPVSFSQPGVQKGWQKEEMRDRVNKRLTAQQPDADTEITKIRVDNIVGGWLFDNNNGNVVSAFIHYGTVFVKDSSGETAEKQYSFVERLDNGNVNDIAPSAPQSTTPLPPPGETQDAPMQK